MRNPFRYRPHWEEVLGPGESPEDESDWEDNWLSNSMAWVSDSLFPNWCSEEDHWTLKVTGYIWAECSCCLTIRAFLLGTLVGGAATTLAVVAL